MVRDEGATETVYIAGIYEEAGSNSKSHYTFGGTVVAFREQDTGVDERYYLASDHLGTNSHQIKYSDGTRESQYYLPFGGDRGGTAGNFNTDRGYTGQVSDAAHTGLLFYNARYYDPKLRRFISADTIIPDPGNPQDLNRYTYVRNNPVRYSDPSGHCTSVENGVCIIQGNGWTVDGIGFMDNQNRTMYSGEAFFTADHLHALLDILGVVPGVGEIADVANALLYAAEGDWLNAAISAAAIVPIAGTGATACRQFCDEVAQALVTKTDEAAEVLVDSNVTTALKADPSLGGRLADGEQPILSYVSLPEMRSAARTPGGLDGVPNAAYDLPILDAQPDLHLRINIRGELADRPGRFGDGIIGGQAVEFGLPLVTNDRELGRVVESMGGLIR